MVVLVLGYALIWKPLKCNQGFNEMLHKLDSIESIIGPSTISNNWIYVVAIEQKINVFG